MIHRRALNNGRVKNTSRKSVFFEKIHSTDALRDPALIGTAQSALKIVRGRLKLIGERPGAAQSAPKAILTDPRAIFESICTFGRPNLDSDSRIPEFRRKFSRGPLKSRLRRAP